MTAWETRADAEGRQRGTSAFWVGLDEWAEERGDELAARPVRPRSP